MSEWAYWGVIYLAMGLFSLSFILILIRLMIGPTLSDRVAALDLVALNAVGYISAYAITTDESVYFRVAIVLALIAVLGTVAFAYYLEKRGRV